MYNNIFPIFANTLQNQFGILMEKLQTNLYSVKIVGARHHLDDRLLTLWLSQALGSDVIISKQPIPADPMAVSARAWLDGQMRVVGYVAAENRELAHRLLLAIGSSSIKMVITRHREGHTTLLASVVDDLQPVPIKSYIFAPDWETWGTPVKSLPIPAWVQEEEVLAADLADSLSCQNFDCNILRQKLKRYIILSTNDISLETRQQRNGIAHLLRDCPNATAYKAELEQLYSMPGKVGTSASDGDVYLRCISYLTDADNMRILSQRELPSRNEVENALQSFPMGLFDVWLNQRKYIVARLYYACIPRKVLWRFITTLMYHELLSSTPAGNALLMSWANQATEMPDKVLGSLYMSLTWLRDKGNDISPMATRALLGEIQRREQKQMEINVEKANTQSANMTINVNGDTGQMVLGNGKYNKLTDKTNN